MTLDIIKEVEDKRGKIIFCAFNNQFLNIVETKKGYARGGHYHESKQAHIMLSGKIEYRSEDINTKKETIDIIDKPTTIYIPPRIAHILFALEDTLFVEMNEGKYESTNYPRYRNLVEEKLNQY